MFIKIVKEFSFLSFLDKRNICHINRNNLITTNARFYVIDTDQIKPGNKLIGVCSDENKYFYQTIVLQQRHGGLQTQEIRKLGFCFAAT